jgi:hypothetical protein
LNFDFYIYANAAVLYFRNCFPSSDGSMATLQLPPSPLHFIATSWLSLFGHYGDKIDENLSGCSVIDYGISTVTIGFAQLCKYWYCSSFVVNVVPFWSRYWFRRRMEVLLVLKMHRQIKEHGTVCFHN